MRYATWILNFTEPKYGTGPEDSINAQGESAEGSYAEGEVTAGGRILGYFTGEPIGLDAWSFTELTQDEALAFVTTINPTAHVAEDGKIQTQITGEN